MLIFTISKIELWVHTCKIHHLWMCSISTSSRLNLFSNFLSYSFLLQSFLFFPSPQRIVNDLLVRWTGLNPESAANYAIFWWTFFCYMILLQMKKQHWTLKQAGLWYHSQRMEIRNKESVRPKTITRCIPWCLFDHITICSWVVIDLY